ncbi:MAG TPA: HD domain-containing protein [Syntrophomonadaceae bacterium]|nr:HD domain-containing protein [Syntrophomonadaceae bacterium]
MNLRDTLQRHPEIFFVESLAPVEDAQKMGDRQGRFHYQEAFSFLKEMSLDIHRFFYDHYNPLAPFCYFHNYVIVYFPAFTAETLIKYQVVERIKLEENRLGVAMQARDYKTLFAQIDPRLSLLAFIDLFKVIPKEERYHIFWHLYARCDWQLDTFPEEMIRELVAYRTGPLKIPYDKSGSVEIYHGSPNHSPRPEQAFSWTLDPNPAINRATRQGKNVRIFKAQVAADQVLAYLPWKKEREIILFPGSAQEIQELVYPALDHYLKQMKQNGLWELYQSYAARLHREYFYKPGGIHGLAHTKDVLFLSLLLGDLLGRGLEDMDLLAQAALFHDIGRDNDNYDPQHGRESYRKTMQYSLLQLAGENLKTARFIIENHCIDDQEALGHLPSYQISNQKRALQLFNIFKDADGLDRVRIMDLDIRHLRNQAALSLLLAARQLLDVSL